MQYSVRSSGAAADGLTARRQVHATLPGPGGTRTTSKYRDRQGGCSASSAYRSARTLTRCAALAPVLKRAVLSRARAPRERPVQLKLPPGQPSLSPSILLPLIPPLFLFLFLPPLSLSPIHSFPHPFHRFLCRPLDTVEIGVLALDRGESKSPPTGYRLKNQRSPFFCGPFIKRPRRSCEIG
ncbi:hypothetical protein CCMA1212_005060 [Trichoderma ghanense]|uniref:Uncharacterized protein n=1 Tax=Trichoderma ghanense TaxID=65468 RepID=A0ABY2H4G0_9HYPO